MSIRHTLATAAIAAAATLVGPLAASALTIGQVDTFESGTTQGWVVSLLGNPNPALPANIPTGGPAGAGDHFLQLTAVGGGGPGSRLTVINASQWAGNYPAAGVTAIAMDVRNLGASDLALRLLFEDPGFGPPNNTAVSTTAITLPAGGDWTHVVFPIAASDLSATLGSVDAALAGATAIRIFHSTTPSFPGAAIVAQLGVDNIRAVPEPGAAMMIALGIGGLALGRRRA
jgi:hypothetical protein